METIGAFAAKTHLSALLDRVVQGEQITITRHGVPVAVMLPSDSQPKQTCRESVQALKEFRAKHSLGTVSLRSLIVEGRD